MDKATVNREGERGIALVLVLVVLMLCSILALEIKSSASLHMRLARNKRDDFLMREAMRGHLEVIKQILIYDLTENQIETLQDRWADEKYTQFQEGPADEDLADEDAPIDEPISSMDLELEARVEDEARKFNLHNLVVSDKGLREHWEKVFIRLLTIYREEFPAQSISEGEAEQLLENLKEWLDRPEDEGGIPRPATAGEEQDRILVTPDELLMVEGFNREMFYDRKAEEEGEEPLPGLYRYLTLWSEGPVNLNTADLTVLAALFTPADRDLADRIAEWRETESEEADDAATDPDEDPNNNALSSLGDLSKIDGFEQAVIQRNRLGNTGTVRGNRFSVHLLGENSDGLKRQERWVLERNPAGFTTLLMEERNDPTFEPDEEAVE